MTPRIATRLGVLLLAGLLHSPLHAESPATPPAAEPPMSATIASLAHQGREDELRQIAATGGDLAFVTKDGVCAALAAASGGRFALAAKLVQENADRLKASPCKKLQSAELVEYVSGHPWLEAEAVAVVQSLSALKFEFGMNDKDGYRPADRAIDYRLPALARALGATDEKKLRAVKLRNPEEMMAVAAVNCDTQELLALAEKWGRSPELKHKLLEQILVGCGTRERRDDIPALLKMGVDINAEASLCRFNQSLRRTALFEAVSQEDVELAGFLLDHGADINHAVEGITPVEAAVMGSDEAMVLFLAGRGARMQDPKTGRSLLCTILQWQARSGALPPKMLALIPALVKAGADPYFKPKGGASPVEIAAKKKNILLLRWLDVKKTQKKLLDAYTPPKDSPLVGSWSNNAPDFGGCAIILYGDGLAIIGISITSRGPFPWRATSETDAIIEQVVFDTGKACEMRVRLDTKTGQLEATIENETTLLERQPEKTPTFVEMMESFKKDKDVRE